MLHRINELFNDGKDFAFETTLSTRSYVSFVRRAKLQGYKISLLFFWLDSPNTAKERVKHRVENGGHNIPADIIERRYKRGLENLTKLYINCVDYWIIFDNTKEPEVIAEGTSRIDFDVKNSDIWATIIND